MNSLERERERKREIWRGKYVQRKRIRPVGKPGRDKRKEKEHRRKYKRVRGKGEETKKKKHTSDRFMCVFNAVMWIRIVCGSGSRSI